MLTTFLITALFLQVSFSIRTSRDIIYRAPNVTSPEIPLDVFQVEAPLRNTYEGAACQQVIMQHNFTASYGSPYVGTYSPPKNCTFTTTIFNMSITSIGINYDRLGLIFLGDIEVWRTTTAMPVRTGIYYNFQKDMTIFDTLLQSEQKVIMELDNIYDSVFTGNYDVTMTALYFNDHDKATPADLILPISAELSSQNKSSVLSLPDGNATVSFTLPRNVERAVVSILASGNGAEEFWYTNVPTQYDDTFNNTALSGYGPWREVQLLVDGQVAGVGWPFPTVFTGGISPGLWVPIVGIDTYDLPSFEIDISPWLGVLCDGKSHTFAMEVVGYDSVTTLGTVGSNWWITGSIFLWVDSAGSQTTGTTIQSSTAAPSFDFAPTIGTASGLNTSLLVSLSAHRTISHSSTITTSHGPRTLTWSQSLSYINKQNFTALGYNATLYQLTSGTSSYSPLLSHPSTETDLITNSYSYPISFTQQYIVPIDPTVVNSTLIADLDRSKLTSRIPILSYLTKPSVFSAPEVLSTRQNGSCIYFWNNTYYDFAGAIDPAMGTLGATEQWFSFSGPVESGGMESYGRHVRAIDGYVPVLTEDETFDHTIEVPETQIVPGNEL
ncbi:uncharacterized protein LY89DRAFT_581373 [Mollisia scopiformis]|uniref:Peptide N-acetyl-beta-D-glucosaminyl asparaginase amidase A N-terminal domain-containing protein n=1 Tax=Mollisia scopiformis TaxID=149040 RepID=A0A194XFV6_MOLSC|nr:uncharacterized protein LY89DRAFT_581373 [Mollisia scopiformis]KUJ19080.1 hypothetical protein LY89DRAFT_581373 [Mollisia scopiformis]